MAVMPCSVTLFSSSTKYSLILSRYCLLCSHELLLWGRRLPAKKKKKKVSIQGPVCFLHSFYCAAHCQASQSKTENKTEKSLWITMEQHQTTKHTHVILGRAQEFHSFSFNPQGEFVHFPGIATMVKTVHSFALNWGGFYCEPVAVSVLWDNSSCKGKVRSILRYSSAFTFFWVYTLSLKQKWMNGVLRVMQVDSA